MNSLDVFLVSLDLSILTRVFSREFCRDKEAGWPIAGKRQNADCHCYR